MNNTPLFEEGARRITEAIAAAKIEADAINEEARAQKELGMEIDQMLPTKLTRLAGDLEKKVEALKSEFGITDEECSPSD